jgi:hypothetical protein
MLRLFVFPPALHPLWRLFGQSACVFWHRRGINPARLAQSKYPERALVGAPCMASQLHAPTVRFIGLVLFSSAGFSPEPGQKITRTYGQCFPVNGFALGEG